MAVKEIKSLTGIRGLAAIYVAIYHWNGSLFQQKPHPVNHYLSVFISHGYLSVDLFFVLSGFVLSLSSSAKFSDHISAGDYRSFMYKRFCRIFPLYICITILYSFLLGVKDSTTLIVNLALLQGIFSFSNSSIIPPGWSLTNEWVIYFFFPCAFYLIWKIRNRPWILVLSAAILLVTISIFRNPFLNWLNYDYVKKIHGFNPIILFTRGPASFLRSIAAYLLGIFAYMRFEKTKERGVYLKYLALVFFALYFINRSDILIILLMPFFVLYITGENVISKFLSTKVIYFLGLISYSFYVNHFLFIETYPKMSKMIGVNNHVVSFCYVLTGTLLFSTITYYIIEKPAIKYLKRNRSKAVDAVVITTTESQND